jgi:hypothetical protein
MTYGEILIQILSEVTGESADAVRGDVDRIFNALDSSHRLGVELPDDEAEKLLNELRQEKAGILNWLIDGRNRFIRNAQSSPLN